jgi:hypothetical protein
MSENVSTAAYGIVSSKVFMAVCACDCLIEA